MFVRSWGCELCLEWTEPLAPQKSCLLGKKYKVISLVFHYRSLQVVCFGSWFCDNFGSLLFIFFLLCSSPFSPCVCVLSFMLTQCFCLVLAVSVALHRPVWCERRLWASGEWRSSPRASESQSLRVFPCLESQVGDTGVFAVAFGRCCHRRRCRG